ncbi:hypothetical protein HK097_004333 [Rhizophlyctis rosea]|uniref:Uncharacterized protein n=1 Tax=Rhizophlyctis rosea TaxID=64517 RepID=A0AAD5SJZ5_9FUNG|nr:hypothetical protein HK097_004333 [Rhizophlyctis rosea]
MVGKAAFSMATNMALKQVSAYITTRNSSTNSPTAPTAPANTPTAATPEVSQLLTLQKTLERRLAVVAPAIDLCEVVAAQGGSAGVDAVLGMCNGVKRDLGHLGGRIDNALKDGTVGKDVTEALVRDLKDLLTKVEDLVPFLQLALQTSGAHLGARMPAGVGPGTLMKASAAIEKSREKFSASGGKEEVRVGEQFAVRLYTLFSGSSRKSGVDWTWKEEFAKGVVVINRVANLDGGEAEIRYQIQITEDLDDGRYHEELKSGAPQSGKLHMGRNKSFILTDIRRMYYAVAGSLLKIEESHSPVLVLKIVRGEVDAGQESMEGDLHVSQDAGSGALEWLALESFVEEDDEGDSDEEDNDGGSALNQHADEAGGGHPAPTAHASASHLTLLERIIRLTSLEMSEQKSHLDVSDEKINLYLANEATGNGSLSSDRAGGDVYVPLHPSETSTRRDGRRVGSDVTTRSPLAGKGGRKFSERLKKVDD